MLDFGLLPPEINSGRMYSGPGPGPMLAAAEAWDGLAAELGIASTGYGSTITELTGGPWIGPTSLTMLAAVTPYINWLSTTAAQAEETANQARAAVAAYEAAFATDGAPAGDRGQPRAADGVDRDQLLRPKHPGHHGHRSPLRRDVGPRRRRHVRLCRRLGRRLAGDPVRHPTKNHQPRRRPAGKPPRSPKPAEPAAGNDRADHRLDDHIDASSSTSTTTPLAASTTATQTTAVPVATTATTTGATNRRRLLGHRRNVCPMDR